MENKSITVKLVLDRVILPISFRLITYNLIRKLGKNYFTLIAGLKAPLPLLGKGVSLS
jgi:hypothetical protein